MSDRRAWGIFRERDHSPGRESDDDEILRLTAKMLEAREFQVTLKRPDELGGPAEAPPPSIFLMCERVGILQQLRDWQGRGVRLVNAPLAVSNTYRESMLALLTRAGIPVPRSRIVSTAAPDDDHADGVWVKRADVHYTREGDVVFARDRGAVREALGGLAKRGIERAVIQQHVEGDLIKFYGVGTDAPGSWFRWFYHRDQHLAGHPFDRGQLAAVARAAAAALGLAVFGGDAIAATHGTLALIDLNAWPSFALYRDEAASEIAAYLDAEFSRDREARARPWR